MAHYTLQATEHEFDADKAQLTFDIQNAYWSLFKAIELKKVVDENVSQMQSHLTDVQNMLNAGMVTNNNV